MFSYLGITLLTLTAVSSLPREANLNLFSDEFIDLINRKQSSWTAGRNFHPDTNLSYIERLCGVHGSFEEDEIHSLPVKQFKPSALRDLPENFDARDEWPDCPSLKHIRDQAECGSCWAVSGTHVMTDRICIASKGADKREVSAGDLLACCGSICGGGCSGVSSIAPLWKYWTKHGIATGGDYGTSNGCVAYQFPFCGHGPYYSKYPSCISGIRQTPTCHTYCDSYQLDYDNEKVYGKSAYRLPNEDIIKQEIYDHGPVQSVIQIYDDFFVYKSGVYQHLTGAEHERHAVKIIGWGVENRVKYWLVANSWNEEWGDNGFFKIRRGTNECGIERLVYAGQPRL